MSSRENSILIDWLSITSKTLSPEAIISMLGMQDCNWQQINGARGYQDRYWYDCISIHFNGREDMGVWLEMSGQGCRAFETYGNGDYNAIFNLALNNTDDIHITRLDVAYDDYCDTLDIDRLCKHTLEQKYRSLFQEYSVTQSSKGQSIQLGSSSSTVLVRIYDKLAERLSKLKPKDKEKIVNEIPHWIRVELQMRDERAVEFARHLVNNSDIGKIYSAVVRHYLEYGWYRYPEDRKLFTCFSYWDNFLNNSEKISLYISPGVDYNLARCENYVFNCAGNAIDALMQIYGDAIFKKMLNARQISQNAKYINLIEKEKQWNDEQRKQLKSLTKKGIKK